MAEKPTIQTSHAQSSPSPAHTPIQPDEQSQRAVPVSNKGKVESMKSS